MRIAVLRIEGMTCEGCALAVESALKSLDGVSRVSVHLRDGKAIVVYDPGRVSLEDVKRVVESAGYGVKEQ